MEDQYQQVHQFDGGGMFFTPGCQILVKSFLISLVVTILAFVISIFSLNFWLSLGIALGIGILSSIIVFFIKARSYDSVN